METSPETGAATETQVKCSWRRSKSTLPFGEGADGRPTEELVLGVAPGEEERPTGGNRARRAAQLEAPRWAAGGAPAAAGAG